MPSFCAVVGCAKRAERDQVRFFRIPAAFKDRGESLNALSRKRRECWIKALKRGELSETFLKNARICSNHFLTGAPAELQDKDNPDWVPTQNMGYTTIKTKTKQATERHNRILSRAKRFKEDTDEDTDSPAGPPMECHERSVEEENKRSIGVQTDMTVEDITKLLSDMKFSTEKIQFLQEKLTAMNILEELTRLDLLSSVKTMNQN